MNSKYKIGEFDMDKTRWIDEYKKVWFDNKKGDREGIAYKHGFYFGCLGKGDRIKEGLLMELSVDLFFSGIIFGIHYKKKLGDKFNLKYLKEVLEKKKYFEGTEGGVRKDYMG